MHRFLGYDLSNMTNQYVSFVCDLVLLVIFIFFLRPAALALIYTELGMRVCYNSIAVAIRLTVMRLAPRVLFESCYIFVFSYLYRGREHDHARLQRFKGLRASRRAKTLRLRRDAWHCIACVMSLSLFLRWFSGRPSGVELRKHDQLKKVSVLYMVFRHII